MPRLGLSGAESFQRGGWTCPFHKLELHEEDALPVSPDSAQQHPKLAVDIRELRPFHRTTEDGKLLPKSDILESQFAMNLEGRDESGNQRRNHAGMVLARSLPNR